MSRGHRSPVPPIILVLLLSLVLASRVHAYIDPGTGSYIIQVAIAAVLTGLVVLKHSWHRVRGFFKGSSRKETTDLDQDD